MNVYNSYMAMSVKETVNKFEKKKYLGMRDSQTDLFIFVWGAISITHKRLLSTVGIFFEILQHRSHKEK